jgi:hypothetical protein
LSFGAGVGRFISISLWLNKETIERDEIGKRFNEGKRK